VVKKNSGWRLDDIFKVEDFGGKCREVEKELEKVEKWGKEVDPDMTEKKFREMMIFLEGLGEKVTRVEYLWS